MSSELQEINRKLDILLNQRVDYNSDRVLGRDEVMVALKISKATFYTRIPALIPFGLYKDGRQWKITKKSLEKYLLSLKSRAKVGRLV